MLVVAVLSTLVALGVAALAGVARRGVRLARRRHRPVSHPVFALAGAQLAGLAAFFVGDAVGIGDVDSYGDHPLAGDVSVVLSSLLTAAAVWLTLRSSGERSDR